MTAPTWTPYTEEYRGRTIVVVRDDSHPIVMVKGGNSHLTVAQARRAVDHFRDRTCAAHDGSHACLTTRCQSWPHMAPTRASRSGTGTRRPPTARPTGS